MKVIIATGGTLGHTKPAVEIAKELKKQKIEVVFVTDKDHFDYIKKNGFCYHRISLGYFKRILSLRALVFPFRFFIGLLQSYYYIGRINPDIIIGMGGFVSMPIVFLANMKKIPIYLCEQNARPGRANRILQRYAKAVFVSFKISEKHFKSNKALYCFGNPVNKNFFNLKKNKEIIPKKYRNWTILLIFGGTNGAEDINNAIVKNYDLLIKNKIFLIHLTGKDYYKEVYEFYKNKKAPFIAEPFSQNIEKYYEAADLVICRAGSNSIFELSAAGKNAIFVPHPSALDNHQYFNAKEAEREGSMMILSRDLDGSLMKAIIQIKNNKVGKRNTLAEEDSAEKIVNLILKN